MRPKRTTTMRLEAQMRRLLLTRAKTAATIGIAERTLRRVLDGGAVAEMTINVVENWLAWAEKARVRADLGIA